MSSRLFQKIREERGLVYSIYSSLNLFRDAGALLVYAGTAPKNAGAVARLILEEFRLLRGRLVSADELNRAKQSIKGAIMLSLESSSSRMTHLAQQMIYYGRFYKLAEILDNIESVKARDIRALANDICDAGVFSLAALGSRNGRDLNSVSTKF
jgi:predicted Zn-dependent peptidase